MSAEIRNLVSQSSRVLGSVGLDDYIWGHSSARDPEGRGAWIKRSGIGLSEVKPDDVQLVGRDGTVVEGARVDGGGDRHLEYPIHTEIFAARPDVGGIVHIHPQHAVALAAAGIVLTPVSHQGTLFWPPSPPVFVDTTDLIHTPELGAAVAEVLGDRNAVFLRNHGVIAVGPDVKTATMTAILLEEACAQQLRTIAFGGEPVHTDPDEARAKRERIYSPGALEKVWSYMLRQMEA